MDYDVIVFGATSFVGKILCRYLLENYGDGSKGNSLRWAVAARSGAKLDDLFRELAAQGCPPGALSRVIADAGHEESLQDMCRQTRVVISTVGPYALYGEPLIAACTELGTDYCDLTGEPQWIHAMIQKYEVRAKASGARMVHCCGFDSIPSDMGVWHLQQAAIARHGEPCVDVRMRVKAMKGAASGGTVASVVNLVKQAAVDPALRRQLADPYSICPPEFGARVRQREVRLAAYDKDFSVWTGPFVMAAINTRIVLRSMALMSPLYGPGFSYNEAVMTGKGPLGRLAALALAGGLASFMMGVVLPPTRWALEKFVLPAPGQGPTPEAQKKGFFDLRFAGTTASGKLVKTKVTGDRDPGYGSTAKMLAEAAICLAIDAGKQMPGRPRFHGKSSASSLGEPRKNRVMGENTQGGFWTPASLFGDALLQRLQDHAGLTFTVTDTQA